VRSTSEVLNHVTLANFHLLSLTGPQSPADLKPADMEKAVTAKAEVIAAEGSLDAVEAAHAGIKSADLQRKLKWLAGQMDGMYPAPLFRQRARGVYGLRVNDRAAGQTSAARVTAAFGSTARPARPSSATPARRPKPSRPFHA
jgi:hypothetical protein